MYFFNCTSVVVHHGSLLICKYCVINLFYERRFITFVKKPTMKTQIIIKVLFLFPILLFIDYVTMALIGCTTSLFGLGNDFYCGPYCLIGKIIIGTSAILFFFLIFPDIKTIFKIHKNATST
jgi:hypothetical protein